MSTTTYVLVEKYEKLSTIFGKKKCLTWIYVSTELKWYQVIYFFTVEEDYV